MKSSFLKRLSRRIRGRKRCKILSGHGIGVLADSKNGLIVVHADDFNVSRTLLQAGEYHWLETILLSSLLNETSRLIFAGAHFGSLLVPIMLKSGSSMVMAYEPSPRNFRLLNVNLLLNKLGCADCRNTALGESSQVTRFTQNISNSGNSRIAVATGEIEVQVDTMDGTVPPEWDSIDLIVMDIEGYEVAAMRGGTATLARTKRLYVEFAPDQLTEQGNTAEQFVELVSRYFKSAYVLDRSTYAINKSIPFIRASEFQNYLLSGSVQEGFLVNLLFTQDTVSALRWITPYSHLG